MKKFVSVLGSTGSIGLNALEIFKKKKNLFKINVLVANKNYRQICNQIKTLKPNIFVVNDTNVFKKVKKRFNNKKFKILNNIFKINNLKKSDITVAAIPGIAGLSSTIYMTKNSNKILIANKESIICGWDLIKKASGINKTTIIPIDSEHFSIMKLLENQNMKEINKVYLTASGGPFLNFKISKLSKIKPREAIRHPKWKMGKKISIDSATLMNKMLENVEAQKLFSIKPNMIEIIIHPESLVHAVIELKNGLNKFIYHNTTMTIPLANAIFDGKVDIQEFIKKEKVKKNRFFLKNLNFLKVNKKRFPIINLLSKINKHPSTPIIVNAANEILVDQFLKSKLPFNSFYRYISYVLNDRNYKKYAIRIPKNINQIYKIDEWARKITLDKIGKNV